MLFAWSFDLRLAILCTEKPEEMLFICVERVLRITLQYITVTKGKNVMKKISFIGAGSLQFTSSCVRDLLTFPNFKECEFALMDTYAKHT